MRKYLIIDIDVNSSNCFKPRICFKNVTWAEMRQLFQNWDIFENENKNDQKLILTPYYQFKVDNYCFNK